jgi:hypothetical protein
MKIRKWALLSVGSLAVVGILCSCGNRQPASALAEAPAPSEPPAPIVTPAPVATPTFVPSNSGYSQPLTGSLVISSVEKVKQGMFFKKLEVKGTVLNTSTVPLSGTLRVEFKDRKGMINKSLVVVETKTVSVVQLPPGQTLPFTILSDKTGLDDATVTVETTQPVTGALMPGMLTSGGAFGAPVSMGTYGMPVALAR